MAFRSARNILTLLISAVWIGNGLFCKVLHLVPRHEQIVGKILGTDFAPALTLLIGAMEVVMGIWVLTGYRRRLCTVIQMAVVAAMNIIEFVVVPDLLLFGRLNIVFALLFVLVVYVHGFLLAKVVKPGH